MAELTLSFISNYNERVEPLMNGTVKADGIEIIPTYSHPSETFWRQLKFQEFQVAEMSMSSFLIARSRGADMIALPVFPSRRFFHAEQSYHVDSGIKAPGDLNGKRIGVGEYQQTAALWARGVLEHDFGVSQYKVHWYMERTEELSHGGATGFTPPPGISFNRIPPDKSMATMLVNHEIDVAPIAGHLSRAFNVIDRSTHLRGNEGDWSKIKPLFPDEIAEAKRFFTEHGFVPVNHTYIVRGDVYREQPGIAMKLYEAFNAAKAQATVTLLERTPAALMFGPEYLAMTRSILGDDPFPYGIKANQAMIDTIVSYSHEQGLTPRKMKNEELFAAETLET
ncbi:MAG: 4,5-dihydroxyphthalate decarboxylase [Candidatus Binatota bacterium]|nr:4,5-dihydroxyphthalate decarboxylase [Candidatus Binatota bacterium]